MSHSIYDYMTLVVFKFPLIFRGFPVLFGRFIKLKIIIIKIIRLLCIL